MAAFRPFLLGNESTDVVTATLVEADIRVKATYMWYFEPVGFLTGTLLSYRSGFLIRFLLQQLIVDGPLEQQLFHGPAARHFRRRFQAAGHVLPNLDTPRTVLQDEELVVTSNS
ncbi:hypothetical protein D3C80_838630 [compost metagenome]